MAPAKHRILQLVAMHWIEIMQNANDNGFTRETLARMVVPPLFKEYKLPDYVSKTGKVSNQHQAASEALIAAYQANANQQVIISVFIQHYDVIFDVIFINILLS